MNIKFLEDKEKKILIFKNEGQQILEFIEKKIWNINKKIINFLERDNKNLWKKIDIIYNDKKTKLKLKISQNKEKLLSKISQNIIILQLEISKLKENKSQESIEILKDLEKKVVDILTNLKRDIKKQINEATIINKTDSQNNSLQDNSLVEATIEFNENCLTIIKEHSKSLKKLPLLENKEISKLNKELENYRKHQLKILKQINEITTKIKCLKEKKENIDTKLKQLRSEQFNHNSGQKKQKSKSNFFNFIKKIMKKIMKFLINKKSKSNLYSFSKLVVPFVKKEQQLNKQLNAIENEISSLEKKLTVLNNNNLYFDKNNKDSECFNSQVTAYCNNEEKVSLPSFSTSKLVRTNFPI